jgi:flagellar assembly protein FliH
LNSAVRTPRVLKGAEAARATSALGAAHLSTFETKKEQVQLNPLEIAEAARTQGFEQGYNEGLEAAHAAVVAATEDANKRVRRALAALSEAVDNFDRREATALVAVENEILTAAFAIARSVLQREIATAADPGAEALARSMELLPERGDVVARMNPDDVATLSMELIETSTRNIRVVPDPRVELGGCIVEVGDTKIDAQVSSALTKVGEALGVTSVVAGSNPTNSRTTSQEAPL